MECPVCLEVMRTPSRARTLRCGHTMHTHCALEWMLRRQTRCPLCRGEMRTTAASDSEEDGSDEDAPSPTDNVLPIHLVLPQSNMRNDAMLRARGITSQIVDNETRVALMHDEQRTAMSAHSAANRPAPNWARRWRHLTAKYNLARNSAAQDITCCVRATGRAQRAQRRLLRAQRKLIAHWNHY